MLSRLKAQLKTWYLRYYFFYDPQKYQAISTISGLLFRGTATDDRLACREAIYLFKQAPVGQVLQTQVLQPLLDSLFTLLAESNVNQWIAQYHRMTELPAEEHRDHVLQFKRSLDFEQIVSLHIELVALYRATECRQILSFLAAIYERVPTEIFWQFWDDAMDVAHLDERYPFAAKAVQQTEILDDNYWINFLENARLHCPVQKCLIDTLITRSDVSLPQYSKNVQNFYHLAKKMDEFKQPTWLFYAQGCGWLQALGFQQIPVSTSVPVLVFSDHFRNMIESVQRYQSNLRSAPASLDVVQRVEVGTRLSMQ